MTNKKSIGIALLGHGKMGRIHSDACRRLEYIYSENNIKPNLITVIGQDKERAKAFAVKYGYKNSTINYLDALKDPEVTLFVNAGPNYLHYEPSIEAAKTKKNIFCEKPLGKSADDAYKMLQTAEKNKVIHMCGFHFRFIPAIRLMNEIIKSGEIGNIMHIKAKYLQGWLLSTERSNSWRFDSEKAGTGVLGDLGSHLIDVIRYLVSDFSWITAAKKNYFGENISGKQGDSKIDDVFMALFQLESGALGIIETSRLAHGKENNAEIEIYGTNGSLLFNMERFNELRISDGGPLSQRRGYKTVYITDIKHPLGNKTLGNGHTIGWDFIFVHELAHCFNAVVNGSDIRPEGATFLDGYRCSQVIDSAITSSLSGKRINIKYKI